MSGLKIHLSEDLIEPLELVRVERCDKSVGSTARALLRQILISRGLLDIENPTSKEA